MMLPPIPKPAKLSALSPTLYEDLLLCRARAVWRAFGSRDATPENPAALLGTCFHEVLAAAQTGRLKHQSENQEEIAEAARQLFDQIAAEKLSRAGAVFRAKFATRERLPRYYLRREEAAQLARQVAISYVVSPATTPPVTNVPRSVERRLQSKDGLLYGRPDVVDAEAGEVKDYKTRRVKEEQADKLDESEARQLRLYAYLANENGWRINRGVIVLASGQELPLPLNAQQINAEADDARATLAAFNQRVNEQTTFAELASPSPAHCRDCPCRMVCDPFWQQSQADWGDGRWAHVEGRVAEVKEANLQGTKLLTLALQTVTGTIQAEEILIEHLPEQWLSGCPNMESLTGLRLRIINARISPDDAFCLSVDRVKTEVWLTDNSSAPSP